MKKKNITDRPIIIVAFSTTKWRIHKTEKGQIVFQQNGKTVKPKPTTFKEGWFNCTASERWYERYLNLRGEFINYPDLPQRMTYKEAVNILNYRNGIILIKTLPTYFNTKTKEKTHDSKIAAKWFKGEDPIYVSREKRQQVGIWVEPALDHVEIDFYRLDKCNYDEEPQWRKVKDTGFWLYPDGSVSHFYKGRMTWGRDREFTTKRQFYLTLDPRSQEFTTCQWVPMDLRNKSILKGEGQSYLLSEKTLKILEKVGFPERFWTWGGDSSRKISRPNDLISYAKIRQTAILSKTGTKVGFSVIPENFDIDNLESLVTSKKGGLSILVPGILMSYTQEDGSESPYPNRYMRSEFKPRLKRMEIFCRYQLWIKNDASQFVVSENIHFGGGWKSVPFYSVHLEPLSVDARWGNDYLTTEEKITHANLCLKINKAFSYIIDRIFAELPKMAFYKQYFNEADGIKYHELWSFLQMLNKTPKTLEFALKQQKELQTNFCLKEYNAYTQNYYYSLKGFLRRFGLRSDSFLEQKSKNMYQNLNVTKEQFKYLASQAEDSRAAECMLFLREHDIPVPIRTGIPQYTEIKERNKEYKTGDVVAFRNLCYRFEEEEDGITDWKPLYYSKGKWGTDITKIPLKYVQTFIDVARRTLTDRGNYYITNYFGTLFNYYGFEDLKVMMNRGLRLQTFADYLNVLERIRRRQPDFDDTPFNRIPADQKELEDLHNELNQIYNLQNEQNYYGSGDTAPTETMNAKYAKKLKDLQQYAMETDEYVIIVPQQLQEIVQEGASLRHCSATYINRVAKGETFFFFLRKKESPGRSLITFNIVANSNVVLGKKWHIDQIHGYQDRSPSDEEYGIVRKWALLNGATINNRY